MYIGFPDSSAVRLLSAIQDIQGTQVQPLGREDPMEGEWQPTLQFMPGKSQGQRTLAGYSPWGHKESDNTEHTCMHAYIYSYVYMYSLLLIMVSSHFRIS